MRSQISGLTTDPAALCLPQWISTLTAVHLTGTESQADSDFWHSSLMLRVTASLVKRLISNQVAYVRDFWKERNLAHVPAI